MGNAYFNFSQINVAIPTALGESLRKLESLTRSPNDDWVRDLFIYVSS